MAKATGGSITTSGGWVIHSFTSSGTFTPLFDGMEVEYLIIGGGGGGGSNVNGSYPGGGGGAGRHITNVGGSKLAVTKNTGYTITVGGGGAGENPSGSDAANGGNSSAFSITATGGGRGGGESYNASSGGSGGGGRGKGSNSSGAGNSGGAGSGNNGGNGKDGGSNQRSGGGGGGAGAAGQTAPSNTSGGAGGAGLANSITGSSVTRAGGGGGGADPDAGGSAGSGGSGGGGNGSKSGTGGSGTANTGSGGGGTTQANGGNGGSGIVIVRYEGFAVVTTDEVQDITPFTVQAYGEVVDSGGLTITERGFVYGTSPNPTTSGSKKTVAGTTGAFDTEIDGLDEDTTYYIRAYAINAAGTVYGNEEDFHTDIDTVVLDLNESVAVSYQMLRNVSKVFSEVGSITSSVLIKIGLFLFSGFSITDAIQRGVHKVFAHSVAVLDTIYRSISKVLSEIVAITATSFETYVRFRSFTNSVQVTDSINRGVHKIFLLPVAVSAIAVRSVSKVFSSLAIAITPTIDFDFNKTINNIVLVRESFVTRVSKIFSNNISITDQLTKLRAVFKAFSEVVQATDSFAFLLAMIFTYTIRIRERLRRWLDGVLIIYNQYYKPKNTSYGDDYKYTVRGNEYNGGYTPRGS